MKTPLHAVKYLFANSLTAILLVVSLPWAYAQKDFLPTGITGHKYVDAFRTVTDTLDNHFDSATVTLYASPNGGFVGGNSGFHETAKAQEFDVDTFSYAVDGFIYWFGYKAMQSLVSDSSKLVLRFWNNNYSVVVGSVTRLAPFSVFDSSYLYINDLVADTIFGNGANVWMITPRTVSSNYSVGFTMEHLDDKDTISLMMSTDGDAPVTGMSWEKWSGNWNIISNTWGLDADFAIFPLVDFTTASIEDGNFIEGISYSVYPNPSTDWMNVGLNVQTGGEYSILIHDLGGRLLMNRNLGYLSQGAVSTSIEVFDLPAGNYIMSVTNGKRGLSKRFVKQ